MSVRDLVRPTVRDMRAYDEEPGGGLNLMANTNLFGPNPAIRLGLEKVHDAHLAEYPSLTSVTLRAALAKYLGVKDTMVITGNGSNEMIDIILRSFVNEGDRVAYHWPTFSMIPVFVKANHGRPNPVPLLDGWKLDTDRLIKTNAKVTMIVQPNNPTGNAFPREDLVRLVQETSGIVVVDEAYVEFLDQPSFVREVGEGADRLVVLRTMSKAHGLAGLRIGYCVASPDITTELNKVRGPFRLNVMSEAIGTLAVSDPTYVDGVVRAVRAERPRMARMLEKRGFVVYPSDANFLFTKPPVDARRLAAALSQQGVWTRDFGGDLTEYLRVTVGPSSVTDRLERALDDVLPKLQEAAP